MTRSCDALVVGAGGFLGGHLVRSLLLQGLEVRAVDVRPLPAWSQVHPQADNRTADLSVVQAAVAVTSGATTVYDLAAAPLDALPVDRMTGVLTDTHLLLAARDTGVDRFVFASSAVDVPAAESATTPDNRCWRHLFGERMAQHFFEDFALQTRIARLGPVYGEHGTNGADLPAVAVVTRMIAAAVATGARTVELPYRADDIASHVYVDDAVLGLQLVAHGTDAPGPHVIVDPSPATVAGVGEAVVRAAGVPLELRFAGSDPTPHVVGDTVDLVRAVDWQPDIHLDATIGRFWTTTSAEVRQELDLAPNMSERWARRRVARPGATPLDFRTTSPAVGRHRYENAG